MVLLPPDPQVTTIDLTSTEPMQVAAGSVVTDSSGTRQAVAMIPQGTTATLVLPNGTTQPLTTLTVRLTEYTVGANGPQAMPAELPPTSEILGSGMSSDFGKCDDSLDCLALKETAPPINQYSGLTLFPFLVVNGGGPVTLNYEQPGRLPAQRQVTVPWQEYTFTKDVVLIPPDPQATTVDLSSSTSMQVAQGTVVTDDNGSRQATVLFPPGTQAEMVLPDGSTQPLTTLHVRATEYTAGDTGPQAMPAQLPPSSAYTYAVELSADEAIAAGATEVRFNQALPLYVDNFLSFPVGTAVPLGSYDRQQGVWLPADNGQVVQIVSVTDGLAALDITGDNVAEDTATLEALGITVAERAQVAQLYLPGRSLWRMTVSYFSRWDCNWPGGPPADAISPNGAKVGLGEDGDGGTLDEADGGGGVEYQNQVKSEQVELTGTPFTLHYRSDRTRGRQAAYTVNIPLTGATLPASLKRIELTVQVAGRKVAQSFAPQANLSTTSIWDGLDAYGRRLQGRQPVQVNIEFVYDVIYQKPADSVQAFAQLSGVPVARSDARARAEFLTGRQWTGHLGTWDAKELGLGGWSLEVLHAYDPIGQTLYSGDGRRRSSQSSSSENLNDIATTVAGTGTAGFSGDGGPGSFQG